MSARVPFSVLDLAHIGEGQSVSQAIAKSKTLAQCAEACGYQRIWLAEHHGMRGVASAATAVMLAAIGGVTRHIRIGSGGIMLPNHPPLVIAEQFGTLAALYPDRIDLGLGRAPGTDTATARALRRDLAHGADTYPADIKELQHFLDEDAGTGEVIAIPGAGTRVPIWLLGSSLYSAQLAAYMGLPYSFASHFAPEQLHDAISLYRNNFRPSRQLKEPFVSAGVMAVVAQDEAKARFLYSSVQQQFANLRRGANNPMPPPVNNISSSLSEMEIQAINATLRYAVVGTPRQASDKLQRFIAATQVDEVILSFPIAEEGACLDAVRLVSSCEAMLPQAWAQ